MDWEEIEFNHFDSIQIRFNDIDGLGHVNNAVQAEYFDFGRMRYFERLSGSPINWKKFAMVIASVYTDYSTPIFLKEDIVVKTKVYKIGEKSLKMVQIIADADTGEIKSTCKSVMVAIDFKSGKSVELTDPIKEMVGNFENS